MISVVLTLLSLAVFVHAGHYKGGTITWKPVDPYTNASTVEIIIIQSHSWTLSRFLCNQATITGQGTYTDGGGAHSGEPNIQCRPNAAACTGSGYVTINQRTFCTDFSSSVQTSSGSLIKRLTVARTTNIIVGFASVAWATEIRMANGVTASSWSVVTKIDLTQTYPLNSSPVTGSLPLIRVIEGTTAVIQIPAADWDTTDDVRCRWALASGPAGNECGDVCANVPGASLSASDCTITWLAVRRPVDISANRVTSSYLAALMVEDFVSTSSTTPLSSVPLQMVIYTYQRASGSCTTVPAIIGDRPNRACIGVPIGVLLVERIVATVYCPGDSIVEFLTTTPLFVNKTILAPVSGTVNQWFITLSWVPTVDQRGPQVFCAAPIDQRGLTGSQHCINFVVGFAAPNLITPILVQGSASPLGTVLSNHSLFSIQASGGVNRPTRNGTYVRIFERTNPFTAVWERDCGYSPDCIYAGTTVLFRVQNPNWTFGAFYYILLDSGAASGNVFCSPESSPILDPAFWTFDIWNPGLSSTTPNITTTTAPTAPTVTTRPPSTTTPVPNMTTVGIVVTTTTAGLTTSTTTILTTSTVTTSTVTTGTVATTTAGVAVMTAKDFETQCQQPVAIMTAVGLIAMLPIHVISMFTLFTKINKMFNPQHMAHMARKNKIGKSLNMAQAW